MSKWIKPFDGVTKYGQKCELNFDNDDYFFDSGVATADRSIPEWTLDDMLNKGKPLKFQVDNKWLRFGGLRWRRIDNQKEDLELTGHWTYKIDGDGHWKRVLSRK